MDNQIFAAYFYSTDKATGFGNMTLTGEGEISGDDDIRKIEDHIKEHNGFNNVVLMSWQRMEAQ